MSTHAVPRHGCPANGSSDFGVKMRIRTVPPCSGGSTKVVSENPISSANACIVTPSSERVGEDGELVALERLIGEDIGNDVAQAVHEVSLCAVDRGNADYARRRPCSSSSSGTRTRNRVSPTSFAHSRRVVAWKRKASPSTWPSIPLHPSRHLEPAAPRTRNGRGDRQRDVRSDARRRATRPGATSESLRQVARDTVGPVAAVRHQPDCSEIALELTGPTRGSVQPASQRSPRRRVMPGAIVVRDLRKSYGGVEALRGVSFEVGEGEVFGLRPNGAGKTTTVEIPEATAAATAGRSRSSVTIRPPLRGAQGADRVVLQHRSCTRCSPFVRCIRCSRGTTPNRGADDVIDLVGLAGKREARVKTLSGGQKRRLDLGVALVGDPDLVFLDEPTTGFDPTARRSAWEMIRVLRSLGKTILLTTHYLDEAQQLADRVAVIQAERSSASGLRQS